MKKGPKKRNTKAKEGLFLSKKTTLNSLTSKMNFAKVPLTQLSSQLKSLFNDNYVFWLFFTSYKRPYAL